MKTLKTGLMALTLTAAQFAQAKVYTPAPLPPSGYADTEVSTNFPACFGTRGLSRFKVEASFVATASNAFEVAFGKDRDGDGRLSAREAEHTVGWDCGRWFMRGPERGFTRTGGEETLGERVSLDWTVELGGGRARKALLAVEGEEIVWERDQARGEGWLFDPEWDMARVTVRGVEGVSERLSVGLLCDGFVFTIK